MNIKVLKLDNTTSDLTLDVKGDLQSDLDYGLALINRVKNQAQKQGTKYSKTRSDIRTGTSKPYRQKGTGRARQGSQKGPHFVGGGIAHGAKPDFTKLSINKKHKAKILKDVLVDLINSNTLQLVQLDKDVKKLRKFLANGVKTLLVYSNENKDVVRGLNNVSSVSLLSSDYLNSFDLINYNCVLVDESVKEKLTNILNK